MVSKRWTWLTGVAWLFAALTNAHGHVHYCFDGQEPPAAVHLVDSTHHDHELPGHDSSGSEHDDLDIDLPNQALAKVCKLDAPAMAPTLTYIFTFDAPSGTAPIAYHAAPPAPDPHFILPPPRGPPG
jgi:hypothetical protein